MYRIKAEKLFERTIRKICKIVDENDPNYDINNLYRLYDLIDPRSFW
jgi:hypothetical protein